jgi:signal transduction histidine kinase
MSGLELSRIDRALASRRADWVLAGAILVVGLWNVRQGGVPGPRWLTAGCVLVACVALGQWRRRRPLLAFVIVASMLTVPTLVAGRSSETLGLFLLLVTCFYALGRYASTRGAAVGFVVMLVATEVHDRVDPAVHNLRDSAFTPMLFAVVWVIGFSFRTRQLREEQLRARAEHLEREQALTAEVAAGAERSRIARDMHDVIGHHVSVMIVQIQGALAVLDTDPGRARLAMTAVETSGRGALGEMRRVLGLLSQHGAPEPLSPQPGLNDLPALAGQMRMAGLSTTLRIEGTPPAGGQSVDLTAYRIVQEALTNTVKHAQASRADICVCYRPDAIDVSVSDDGRGCTQPAGIGHGLAGMRERASLYGGTVTAGNGPTGGYRVTAHLPRSASVS